MRSEEKPSGSPEVMAMAHRRAGQASSAEAVYQELEPFAGLDPERYFSTRKRITERYISSFGVRAKEMDSSQRQIDQLIALSGSPSRAAACLSQEVEVNLEALQRLSERLLNELESLHFVLQGGDQ